MSPFEEIVEYADQSYLNFELDLAQTYCANKNPIEILKKYPKRFPLLHINNLEDKENCHNHTSIGNGDLEIETILDYVKNSEVKFMFLNDESSRAIYQIPLSIKYFNTIISSER